MSIATRPRRPPPHARLARRLVYGAPVVVVSGLPRSGTSMAMRMLEAGGLAILTDGLRSADEDNPGGYFEHERVKELARDPDPSWLRQARGKAVKIISYLLKDLPPSLNYQVLFLDRDLGEVCASQNKMLARRGESNESSDERMMELYRDHLWKVRYLLRHRSCFESLEVDYGEVLRDPAAQAARMRDFLGRPLDVPAMAAAVDERLYRNRRA